MIGGAGATQMRGRCEEFATFPDELFAAEQKPRNAAVYMTAETVGEKVRLLLKIKKVTI